MMILRWYLAGWHFKPVSEPRLGEEEEEERLKGWGDLHKVELMRFVCHRDETALESLTKITVPGPVAAAFELKG